MNNAIQVAGQDSWLVMREQANALVKSGFLPQSIKTPEQALAIMMLGQELGLPYWTALLGVNVIQGKPTIAPQLMLALINRTGQVENIEIVGDAKVYTVTIKRRGRSPHSETFTMQDAAAMGLAAKDNYRKQPAVMLKWRAVAACCRVTFPDAIAGMYTPDEMGAETNEDGEVVTTHAPQLATKVETTTGEITVTTPAAPALSLLTSAATEVLEGEEVTDAEKAPAITPPAATTNGNGTQPSLMDAGMPDEKTLGKLAQDLCAWAATTHKLSHDDVATVLGTESVKVYLISHSLGDAKTVIAAYMKPKKATA